MKKTKPWLPVLLALAMVFLGIFVPRLLLLRRQHRLLHTTGMSDAREISVYQGEQGETQLMKRIRILSDYLFEETEGQTGRFLKSKTQEPQLDTELTLSAAKEQAQRFLLGLQDALGSRASMADAEELQELSLYDGAFFSWSEDRACSFWELTTRADFVLLDAVSGIPLATSFQLKTADGTELSLDAVYGAAARACNRQFGSTLQVNFHEEPKLHFSDGANPTVGGSSGRFSLFLRQNAEDGSLFLWLAAKS